MPRHRRFGPSSEKDAVQASLFDEVERTAADDERRRRAGGCGARQSPPPQTASPPRPNCHAKTWCMTWRTMPRYAPMTARRCAQSIGAAQRACPVQPGNRVPLVPSQVLVVHGSSTCPEEEPRLPHLPHTTSEGCRTS